MDTNNNRKKVSAGVNFWDETADTFFNKDPDTASGGGAETGKALWLLEKAQWKDLTFQECFDYSA